jgi:environmental stress-induced protein Ves
MYSLGLPEISIARVGNTALTVPLEEMRWQFLHQQTLETAGSAVSRYVTPPQRQRPVYSVIVCPLLSRILPEIRLVNRYPIETMPAAHLPAALHRVQPWKNGLGVSYTVADEPRGAGFDVVDWQVGHTDIGVDCPFSNLPAVDRLFMVIEGKGVELTCVDEAGRKTANRVETMQAPFAFRGDWTTSCRLLDGPVKVFNVMTRRGKFSAAVEIVPELEGLRKPIDETVLAFDPATRDAWLLDGPLAGIGRVVLVRIRKQ